MQRAMIKSLKAPSRQNRKDDDYWLVKNKESPNWVFYVRSRRKVFEITVQPKRNPKEYYSYNERDYRAKERIHKLILLLVANGCYWGRRSQTGACLSQKPYNDWHYNSADDYGETAIHA